MDNNSAKLEKVGATEVSSATDKVDVKPPDLSHKIVNRSLFKPRAKGTYKIECKKDQPEEATVYIYDEISWWGIQAEQFVKDFNAITAGTIHLRLNTPGGSVFDGMAIYNAIKQHKSKIIAHVDGLAASIASVIAMACDEIIMGEGSFLMIHEPWSLCAGSADDMRKEADLLDKVSATILSVYMNRSNKKEEEVCAMMAEETWLNAQEAVDAGFADSVDNKKDEKAQSKSAAFNLSAFANVPEQLKNQKVQLTARDLERVLRDAGCSQKQAKKLLAEGFTGDQRDDDSTDTHSESTAQRDVATPVVKKKDRVADLLIRAEVIAPSKD